MTRRLYLDRSAGEARGVVTLNGKPERLVIERDTDLAAQKLGATMTARLARIDRALGAAFLQLPEGRDAVLPLKDAPAMAEGASLEVTIAAEARRDKGPVVRLIGPSSGPPRLIALAPDLEARLMAFGPSSPTPIETGAEARDIADEAQEAALAAVHPIPGGGSISIEPTRALIAVDVDLGAARPGADPVRAARAANLAAIAEAARLIRLKGLAGLLVIDLAGKGHDGAAMVAAAKAAFAPDGAGVAIGPISRFGLFELALPHQATPIVERLTDEAGRATSQTLALALLRALEREGRAAPGARLVATCSPEVAAAAKPFEPALAARLGPRFVLKPDPFLPRETYEVAAQ